MNELHTSIRRFAQEDDGAQVLEYGLLVAAIALILLLSLRPLADSGYFAPFLTRLANCLNGTCA
jgi:pilus assembly protein Flp/PilA